MVDQARWHYCTFIRHDEKARKRAFFYAYVLEYQLKEAGFKRVKFNENDSKLWIFCGNKRTNIFVDEVSVIYWALHLKGENTDGRKK